MSKRILIITLSFILLVALAATGCAPARRPYNNNNAAGNRTGFTGTGADSDTGIGAGYNRGYDTGNYTGAGANPGTTGYGTGTNYGTTGYGTGYGTTGNEAGIRTGVGANAGNTASDRIATAVKQIEGVQDATAVVTGNAVYVGVTLSGNRGNGGNAGNIRTGGNTGANGTGGTLGATGNTGTVGTTGTTGNANDIERRVSQIVRAVESDARTVYVSTDNNFINRLRTVDQGVRNGRPENGFTNELRSLVKGMTPAK